MTLTQARSNASFQTRLLLHLAQRRRRHAATEGFTLVELMIVVAILGILAAVALPNYLQARNSSLIGSRVSEAVSFAKACAVYQSTQVGVAPDNVSGKYDTETDGVKFTTPCTTTGGAVTAVWAAARAGGVKCLTDTSTVSHARAVITITPSTSVNVDQIQCTFS